MRAYFWRWLVLGLADVKIFFAQESLEFYKLIYVISKISEKVLRTPNSFLIHITLLFWNFLRSLNFKYK